MSSSAPPTSIRNRGSYFPEAHETALDRGVLTDQQQAEQIARSMTLPPSIDPATYSTKLPVPQTGQVIQFGPARTTGTLTEYLANNYVYNVLDYSADPTGVLDSTAAIQAALDAAGGTTRGGEVVFPPGVYAFSNIRIPYGVRVHGAGWQSTLLYVKSGTTGVAITDKVTVAGQGSTGLWICDLEVRGRSEVGLDGIKLGYGGLGADQVNLLGGASRVLVRFFNGDGINVNCNVAELRDVYVDSCNICLRTAGAVLRAYGLALQNSTGGRELQHACKDSVFHNLHVETGAGPGQSSINVAAGGDRTLFDGLTFSGAASKVTGAIVNFATGVTGCRLRHLAINLDQARSDYTNAIFDTDRSPSALTKAQMEDPLLLRDYDQDRVEMTQTPTEAVLVSGVNARQGPVKVTLTAARLVGAPLHPALGQYLEFIVVQDGTGGRAVSWNAVFKQSWSDTGNTANKRSTIAFRYDGTNWNQVGAQSPYL